MPEHNKLKSGKQTFAPTHSHARIKAKQLDPRARTIRFSIVLCINRLPKTVVDWRKVVHQQRTTKLIHYIKCGEFRLDITKSKCIERRSFVEVFAWHSLMNLTYIFSFRLFR